MNELKKAEQVAIRAAIQAGRMIKTQFARHQSLTVHTKSDTSFVTEVDRRSEQIVLRQIKKAFPHHEIHAEETGKSASSSKSEYRWHIDPLDGTTNFIRGFPFFCVSIGLEHKKLGPVVGVLYQPITGDLYHARRGSGAFRNKKKIHVSATNKIANALVTTGFAVAKQRFFHSEIEAFTRISRQCHAVRRTGSAALDLAFVATGQFDAFWEKGLHSWDVCAAIAILVEAGGRVTGYSGSKYKIGQEELLASNGRLHGALLKSLKQ